MSAAGLVTGLLHRPDRLPEVDAVLPPGWAGPDQPLVDAVRSIWLGGRAEDLKGPEGHLHLIGELVEHDQLETVGGAEEVAARWTASPTCSAFFKTNLEQVQRAALADRVEIACKRVSAELSAAAQRPPVQRRAATVAAVQACRDALSRALLEGFAQSDPQTLEEIVRAPGGLLERLTADDTAEPDAYLVPTGLPVLDDALDGGFRAGQLVVLAARPSIGKSAIALQSATEIAAAARDGRAAPGSVLLLSLETGPQSQAERMLRQAGVALPAGPEQRGAGRRSPALLEAVGAELPKPRNLLIDHPRRPPTLAEIESRAKQVHGSTGLRALVIDYVSQARVRLPDAELTTYALGQVTQGLKALAVELEVPVVVLAQLNRQGEEAPTLGNLAQSGAFEQDADVVLLLHRERGQEPARLIVAKNRDGRVGEVPLRFDPERIRFVAAPLGSVASVQLQGLTRRAS